MKPVSTTKYVGIIFFLAGVLLLMWPALYNGYPLVYSDTGTYLKTSIILEPPADRPVGYGFFIRAVTWEATTWTVVIAQAVIIYLLTLRAVKLFFKRPLFLHFCIIFLLAFLSSLPWYTAQLMPDVFAGVVILTVFLFFYDADTWTRRILYGFLLAFFTLFHYSFFPVVFLTATVVVMLKLRRLRTEKVFLFKYLSVLACLGAAVLFVMGYNYSERGKFQFSFSSNVFLVAKFTDGGVLSAYLKDNCGKKDIIFCNYKDSMDITPMVFLWSPNLAFQREHMVWEEVNDRCGVIVHDVLSTAKYRNMFLKEAVRATIAQLQENKIGSGMNSYGGIEGVPGNWINSDFEGEVHQYLNARQNHENMEDLTINRYNQRILIVSTLLIFAGLCYRPVRKQLLPLLVVCLFGVLFNAFATAALANVYDRLQARVTWLLLFGAMLVISCAVKHWRNKKKAALHP